MINYKKSLLSVAAATVLISASLTAEEYLPLTTTANDFQWVSIGISGLKSDGEIQAEDGVFSIDGTDEGEPENTITDASSVDLLPVSGMERGGKDLAKLDAISVDDLEIRIDTTANTYLESDPVRTMYVTSTVGGAPQFSVEYKASMEGQKLEYSIASGVAYETTLSYEKVFAEPAVGVPIEGTDLIPGVDLNSLTETESVVDYDFSDNPPNASEWTATDHRDAAADAIGVSTLRLYGYNAQDQKWEIYDSRNDAGTNDFNAIEKAKAYWARLDNEAVAGGGVLLTTVSDKESGLVLGSPALATADYTAINLAEGWNYIAFDGQQSAIRNAVSGVLATIDGDDDIELRDASGNHSLTIAVTGATNDNDTVAKEINTAISAAVLAGTMPKTFQVKAYPTAAAGKIVAIVSNRKFTIQDPNDAAVTDVQTLAGKDTLLYPNDGLTTDGTAAGVIVDLGLAAGPGELGAMSVYGEYAMVIEPLIDADTAQFVGEASIQIDRKLVAGNDATTDLAAGAAADTAAEVVTALNAGAAGVAGVLSTEIDLDIDGAPQHILVAADEPFSIRDHTFTRVFAYGPQNANSTVTFSNGGSATIVWTDVVADAVSDLDTGITNGAVVEDADGKIIVIENSAGESKYYVAETVADNIQASTSAQDESRGAVKAVISLESLVKVANNNVLTLDPTELADELADAHTISFTTEFGTVVTGTAVSPTALWVEDTDTDVNGIDDNLEYLDAMVLQLNTDLAAAGMTATASHNYPAVATLALAEITVEGSDVVAVAFSQAGGAADAVPVITNDTGYIASYSGDLAVDLKYNYVLTPNYTMNGPLFTMRDSGMALRSLVAGTTDLSSGTGEVSWESIDLTRLPSEWFDSQDYDLFETTANAGYWAYLTASPEENLTITDSALSKEYMHHFDHVDATGVSTTTNYFSGDLDIYVDGISDSDDEKSARVTATVGGETFELTQNALDDSLFQGTINTREARGITAGTNYDVIVNISDGLGSNATYTLTDLFDNVKPSTPAVSLVGGVVSVAADPADDDVTGFYVFAGTPPESDDPDTQAAAALGLLTAPGTVSVACDGQAAAAFDDVADGITILAVDGDGTLGAGNASDADTIPFMRILLDRSLITATNSAGTWLSTGDAVDYNASCVNTGALADHTGITVSSLTDDETAKFAFESNGDDLAHEVPLTVYVVSDLGGTYTEAHAAVTYPESYAGDDVFIELGGRVYGFQLPTAAAITTGALSGNSSGSPYDLTAIVGANNPKDAAVGL